MVADHGIVEIYADGGLSVLTHRMLGGAAVVDLVVGVG